MFLFLTCATIGQFQQLDSVSTKALKTKWFICCFCSCKSCAFVSFTLNVYVYLCNILNKIYFSFLLLFNRSLDDKINKRGFLLLLLQYKTQAGIIRQPSSRPGSSLLSHLVVFGKEQGTLIKKTRRDRARKRHLMTSKWKWIFHLFKKAPRANGGNILQWTLCILSWLFHSDLHILYTRGAMPSGGHIELMHMTTPFCMFSRVSNVCQFYCLCIKSQE